MQAVATLSGFDPVEERIAAPRLLTPGLQHVLVMYAGAVVVPLIVGRALQLSPQEVVFLISAGLFVCGIVTIIQGFGVKLPAMLGVIFAAVGPMVAIASSNPGPDGARMMFGAIMAAGLISTLFAPLGMVPMIAPDLSQWLRHSLHRLAHSGIPLAALAAVGLNWFLNGAPHTSDEDIAAAAHAAEAH